MSDENLLTEADLAALQASAVGSAVLDEGVRVSAEKPAGVLRGDDAVRAVAKAAETIEAETHPAHAAPATAESLSNYTKNLLRIRVPVMVTLARKKQRVSSIIELGPGTILQFQKSCEQLLEIEVNGHEIGQGEAVKVGDKFGLRVSNLTLPGERFKAIGKDE
ncbi:MAG: FliM/FliN family flagellar motor switch protein [Planctomycetia bacterium]|nr:FliM/FliN family flagellar motor switch protein [Planctomycetia bacterium]